MARTARILRPRKKQRAALTVAENTGAVATASDGHLQQLSATDAFGGIV
jgi:hypothetical protein